jgi:ferrous iron transport protein A
MSIVITRTLADLRRGESGRLLPLCLDGDLAHAVMEAGFVPGTVVTMIHSAPWGGPHIYRLDGAEIALRRDLAASLHVEELKPGETA